MHKDLNPDLSTSSSLSLYPTSVIPNQPKENVSVYSQVVMPPPQMDACPSTFLSRPPLTSQMLGQPGAPAPRAPGTGSAPGALRATSALLVFLGEIKGRVQVAPRGNFIPPFLILFTISSPQRHQNPFHCISFPCPYLSLAGPVACSKSPEVLKRIIHKHHQQQMQFTKHFLNSYYRVVPVQRSYVSYQPELSEPCIC